MEMLPEAHNFLCGPYLPIFLILINSNCKSNIINANIILGYTQWIFKELFPSKQWNPSSTQFYLFIQPASLMECSIICTGNPKCRAVFIYENTCFGLSTLTPNSKLISTVRTFIKQPQDGMYLLNKNRQIVSVFF